MLTVKNFPTSDLSKLPGSIRGAMKLQKPVDRRWALQNAVKAAYDEQLIDKELALTILMSWGAYGPRGKLLIKE